MDCKEVKEMLSALADGEIADGTKEEILSHIAECDTCRQEYEELKAIKKEFSKLRIRLNGELADVVMKKITAEAHPKKKTPFILRHLGTAAALIIVAGMFILTRNVSYDNKAAESEPTNRTESAPAKGDFQFSIPSAENTSSDVFDSVEELVPDQAPAESEPMGMPEATLKSESPDLPMAEESVSESQSSAVNDFRLSNSISLDTAIIFVDSDMQTITPLFDSIESIGASCININQPHTEVMQVLYSNSISVTSTDIPESTTDTTIYVE